MQDKKIRQHHVWRHHLSAWATDGNVWCRQDGKIFSSSTRNVAVENEYYRLKPLDERDKAVIRALCVKDRTMFHSQLAESMLGFLDHPYRMIEWISALSPEAAAAIPIETVEINYVEDFFALVESQMCPILEKMRARNLSSAKCQTEAPWLAFFLAAQYFRTKAMEDTFHSALTVEVRAKFDCDWDRVWRVMRVVLACQVGASLHARLEHAEWTILESPSNFDLITSDQPLFNTKADERGEDGYAKEFVLYFPITPGFAVLCDFNSNAARVKNDHLLEGDARLLNKRIADQAYRQVFARRRDELELLT